MSALPRPSKIVCVGRNYVAHAAELGNEVPSEPLIFLKPPSSLIGNGDAILLPPGVGEVHYEGEIGVLMGRRVSRVREEAAMDYVAGIVPVNDVTARTLQRKDSQWSRAKGFDTFCPLGEPKSPEELDLGSLSVVTRVNGEERSRGNWKDIHYSFAEMIERASDEVFLLPGEVMGSGTVGTGCLLELTKGRGPWLQPGDTVELEIERMGVLRNIIGPIDRA